MSRCSICYCRYYRYRIAASKPVHCCIGRVLRLRLRTGRVRRGRFSTANSSGLSARNRISRFLDDAVFPQLEHVVVEQLHALLLARLDRRGDAVGLVLANQVGDGRVDHQHFVGRHPAAADLRQQGLRKDADDRRGQAACGSAPAGWWERRR